MRIRIEGVAEGHEIRWWGEVVRSPQNLQLHCVSSTRLAFVLQSAVDDGCRRKVSACHEWHARD